MGLALSVAGLAMQGFSMIASGQAAAQKDQQEAEAEALAAAHQQQEAERAAKIGKIQADQIDAAYRSDLTATIANIRAIRASTGGGNSPSEMAYIGEQSKRSDEARKIRVGGALIQSGQAASDALFYRTAGKAALLRGESAARSDRIAGIFAGLPYFASAGARAFGYA